MSKASTTWVDIPRRDTILRIADAIREQVTVEGHAPDRIFHLLRFALKPQNIAKRADLADPSPADCFYALCRLAEYADPGDTESAKVLDVYPATSAYVVNANGEPAVSFANPHTASVWADELRSQLPPEIAATVKVTEVLSVDYYLAAPTIE